MKKLRIGIIGMGFIGRQHLDAARRVPCAQVAAICQHRPEAARRLGEEFDVAKVYTDWRELVSDPEIDVVHNCTPNALHDDINREALRNGKHLYCEKPLSNSAAAAREVWRLATENGLAHGLNHQYRLNAAVVEMKARLGKGLAGRPLFLHGWYLQESAARATDWSHRMENTGPARALNDIGIHWVDTAVSVLGQPVAEVMADLSLHYPVRTDGAGLEHSMDTEDTGLILLRFADGTPGSVVVSKAANGHKNDLRLWVECEGYSMAWVQEEPDRLRLGIKEEGVESLYMNPRICQQETRPYVTTPMGHVMGWCDALRNALAAYYGAILDGSYRTGPVPYATFADGFHGMAFVEACLLSGKERRWVEVEKL